MVSVVAVLLGATLVVGLAVAGVGFAALRQWYRLYSQSPSDVHEVLEGPTEFAGTAQPLDTDGTVRSGLTGETCLLYEYEVEQYESSGKHSYWDELVSASDGVPFVVGDETDRVLVDPDGAITVLDREFEERLEPGDDPSDAIATFLDRSDVDRDAGTVDIGITEIGYGDDQRFRERRIHRSETVYVAGVADRRVGDFDVGFGGPDAVVRAPGDRGLLDRFLQHPFVVSDRSETVAERRLLWRACKISAVGAILTWIGGYGVASGLL